MQVAIANCLMFGAALQMPLNSAKQMPLNEVQMPAQRRKICVNLCYPCHLFCAKCKHPRSTHFFHFSNPNNTATLKLPKSNPVPHR